MFKSLFKYLSTKLFLIEPPKQNNVHFDSERREKMKKLNAEINQHYKTLQKSYASRDDDCHHNSACHHSNHDYSSYDDCSESDQQSSSGSCDSSSD